MSGYLIPAARARVETRVLNSRFIATAAPASSVGEARELIAAIRREFPDATHHVSAYLVGHGASVVAHCTDDGEPAGTAGRPALAVLQGSGLGDVAVVVTRYYGGTKLGTGGLVRAYGDAVRAVLEALPRAEKVTAAAVRIVVGYAQYARIRQVLDEAGAEVTGETFEAQVALAARLPLEDLPALQSRLRDASSGAVQAEVLATQEAVPWPTRAASPHEGERR